jgi:hypothetical protein
MTYPLEKRDALPFPISPSVRVHRRLYGGGERIRTDDLLRARQALSQLSYTPESIADLGL